MTKKQTKQTLARLPEQQVSMSVFRNSEVSLLEEVQADLWALGKKVDIVLSRIHRDFSKGTMRGEVDWLTRIVQIRLLQVADNLVNCDDRLLEVIDWHEVEMTNEHWKDGTNVDQPKGS